MRRVHVVFVALVVVRLGTTAACKDPTQITVEITTDVKCTDLRGTSITVGDLAGLDDRPLTTQTTTCDPDRARIGSMVIVPSGADDETVAIRVIVGLGKDPATCLPPSYGPGCIVARRAIRFVPHTSLTLPIFLATSCNGIACGATDTCVQGNCRPATIPDPQACTTAAGCGEGVLGSSGGPPVSGGDAGDAGDGGAAEASTTGCSSQPGSPCTSALAAGWSPLALSPSPSQACPAGYAANDLFTDPGDAGAAAACACTCQISATDPPSCQKGTFTGLVGPTVCDTTSTPYVADGGAACEPATGNATVSAVGNYTLPPYAGTCTASAQKTTGGVNVPSARACVPPVECAEDVCRGVPPAGFASCIAHDGDLPCPGAPFTNRTLAGSDTVVSCGGCATCQNTPTCSVATVRFFSDTNCTTMVASRVANNVCNPLATGTAGTIFATYRYDSTLTAASCTNTEKPITTSFALAAPRTICCR